MCLYSIEYKSALSVPFLMTLAFESPQVKWFTVVCFQMWVMFVNWTVIHRLSSFSKCISSYRCVFLIPEPMLQLQICVHILLTQSQVRGADTLRKHTPKQWKSRRRT